ncbi:MAG: zf-HC2 domain-containing protein [Chloroflexia bacterium]|nr:zf-HC2 domain-containing protein [Chloroflexia bacterium]
MSQSPHIDTDSLSAYLDGDLPDEDRRQIAGHLAGCGLCRRELAELRATVALLRHLPHFRPRRSFQLGPEYRRRWATASITLLPTVRALAIAAVLLFVVVSGFAYVRDEPVTEGDGGPAAMMQQPTETVDESDGTTGVAQSSLNAEATSARGAESAGAADESRDAAEPADGEESQGLQEGGDAQEAAAPRDADQSELVIAQEADAGPTATNSAGDVAPAAETAANDARASSPESEIDRWALASAGLGMLATGLLVAWAALARANVKHRRT